MTLAAGRPADGAGPIVTVLDGQAGLRVRGEVDMLSMEPLREAIAALPADVAEVHLKLAELSFIDVGATRMLLALAQRSARPCLILHQPPRSLLMLIRLLWPGCPLAPAPPGSAQDGDMTFSIRPV